MIESFVVKITQMRLSLTVVALVQFTVRSPLECVFVCVRPVVRVFFRDWWGIRIALLLMFTAISRHCARIDTS